MPIPISETVKYQKVKEACFAPAKCNNRRSNRCPGERTVTYESVIAQFENGVETKAPPRRVAVGDCKTSESSVQAARPAYKDNRRPSSDDFFNDMPRSAPDANDEDLLERDLEALHDG